MPQPQSDAEIVGVIQRSGAFRAVRAVLLTADAAVASSAIARAWPRQPSSRAVGVVLLTAGVTHGVLAALTPAVTAPAGRYVFAVAFALVGAVLLRVRDPRSKEQEHVRTLR